MIDTIIPAFQVAGYIIYWTCVAGSVIALIGATYHLIKNEE